jgi:hypothetical protein
MMPVWKITKKPAYRPVDTTARARRRVAMPFMMA